MRDPEVRFVGQLEHLNRAERYRGEEKLARFDLGPVNVCEYQQTEDDRYVPRYWKNRLDDQIARGVHPTVLGGHSEVEWVPLGEATLRFLDRRRIDIYAICYPGQFSPIKYRDPLRAIELLATLCDNERRPERFCRTCRAYDQRPNGGNAYRPPGTIERSACAGCLISYIDQVERDPEEVQDEKLVEWLSAKERLKDVEARKAAAIKPKDKKRISQERERAIRRVKEAARECKEAGLDPAAEVRKRAERWEPEAHSTSM
ncbi:MAG: hypothetical protein WC314_20785 [Vulcanimicrobiota bacterium]